MAVSVWQHLPEVRFAHLPILLGFPLTDIAQAFNCGSC